MLTLIITAQTVLPLLLLLWLFLFPAAGWLSFTLQVFAVLAVLLGLSFAALWAMPPYWVPWLYLAVLFVIVLWHLISRRVGGKTIWSAGPVLTTGIVGTGLLGIMGGYLFVMAMFGRVPPDVDRLDIAPPFPAGSYLVAHGGANTSVNVHLRTLNPQQPRFLPWRGQSRAIDLFRINSAGFHVQGWYPADPARYETYGTPVLAPCAGSVARVVDGVPDNPVPVMNRQHMAGNFVAVHCGQQRYVVLAHLRNGSVVVSEGEQVGLGDYLGDMGNSGNSSEPHLHVHAQLGLPEENPLGGEPLLLTINGRFLVRNDLLHVEE